MATTNLLERDKIDTSLKELYDKAEQKFGHIPNLVKALSSNPTLCQSVTAFLLQSLGEGRISWKFKELIILKTLRTNKSYYSYGAHEKLAVELGNPVEKVGDIAHSLWKVTNQFSEGEQLVFELIEQITVDANDVSDELWEKLRSHWDNGQLLEINAVITTFIMIGRLGDSLGVADPVLFSKPVSN